MTLLLDVRSPEWMTDEQLKSELLAIDSNLDIVCAAENFDPEKVSMLATSLYQHGSWKNYPNLKVIQKIGAGVDSILKDETIPEDIQVTRIRSEVPAKEIAQFCLTYVLADLRNVRVHFEDQSKGIWNQIGPKPYQNAKVAVLGLGTIGRLTAELFVRNEFEVMGWSRTPKQIPGVQCLAGDENLETVLAQCNYICAILPSTPETRGLMATELFSKFNPDGVLINAGRGDLVVEDDLIKAIDNGMLRGAVLDVMNQEPLPENSPLWSHPGIVLTPHVSGWHLGDAISNISTNYRALESGQPLINRIDRKLGY